MFPASAKKVAKNTEWHPTTVEFKSETNDLVQNVIRDYCSKVKQKKAFQYETQLSYENDKTETESIKLHISHIK